MDDDFDYDRFGDDGRAPNQGHPAPRPRAPARRPRSRSLILIVGLVGVLALGAFVAWAYFAGGDYTSGDDLPVVTADRTPYKVRPEEPGGMDVPNRDKEVYERVGEGGEGEGVERLLPPAEEAEAPEVTEEGDTTQMAAGAAEGAAAGTTAGDSLTPPPPPPVQAAEGVADKAQEMAGTTAESAEGAATQAAAAASGEAKSPNGDDQTAQVSREELPPPPGANTGESDTATPATEPQAETQAPAAEAPAPASEPAAASAPAAGGDYRVQVASIQDRSKAESSWAAIQKKHEDLLGGLTLTVVEVDIEGRGTFYRLQGGGVSKARADEICATLKQRNAGCLIVRP